LAGQTRNTIRNPAPAYNGSISSVQVNTTSFLSGFGAQYFVSRDIGFRVEYQNLGKVGTAGGCGTCTGRANAQFLSASALFTF
jgi:hypothetical protein